MSRVNVMSVHNIEAVNDHVVVIRDEASETTASGLALPEQSLKKPATGKILSVGALVKDRKIKKDRQAIWNQHVGQAVELEDGEVTVLSENQILMVV